MMEQSIIGTGLTGLIGSLFLKKYPTYKYTNLDLSTGIDITSPQAVDEAIKLSSSDTILHLAAFTNVSEAHKQNGDKNGLCYRVNVTGSENIVMAAREYSKYLIHISTDFVFDGSKSTPYTEADSPNPIEWYGETKLRAEELVQQNLKHYLIIRLSYPYQSNPSRPDLVSNIIQGLKAGTLPPVFSDHIITPTYAGDIADVFDYCIQNKPTGIYHCTGSSSHSDYEIASMIKEKLGLKGDLKKGSLETYLQTTSRPYQKTMITSNEKLQTDFGFQMKTFPQGLELLV